MMFRFALLSLLSTYSTWVYAAETDSKQRLASPPIASSALFDTLIGLLLVLACIGLVAWLLKSTNRFNTSANGQLKVLAGLPVGSRERVVLLQVGDQQVLVGITPQQINTLHVLDEKISFDNQTNQHSFNAKLQQIMNKQPPQ